MEVIIILIIIAVVFWIVLSIISEKVKEAKNNTTRLGYLEKLNLENQTKINNLEKENYSLTERNKELMTIHDAVLNEKRIMDVIKVLDENNSPEITKEKLAKLWEVLPYYPPDWPIRKWVVKRRDLYICQKCGKNLYYAKEGLGEVHHIRPLSIGGTNEIKNLIYLCHDCHKKVHDDMFNFSFSRDEKITLFEDWTYYNLFNTNWYLDKTVPARLNDVLSKGNYEDVEPDTDRYYNISYWEEKLKD